LQKAPQHADQAAELFKAVIAESALALEPGAGQLERRQGVLEDGRHRPPHLQTVTERSLEPLPGTAAPVAAQRYACPVDGNYVWYRAFVGVPVPTCPDHDGVALVREDAPSRC
jgi:hypothetical protein